MCEIEEIVQILTKLYIIINAQRLGWSAEFVDNQIILTKDLSLLTNLDKNTPKLIEALIQDA